MTITMHKLPETGWVIHGWDQINDCEYYDTDRIFTSHAEAHKYCSRMETPVKISIDLFTNHWGLDK
jgi:hypothetical protein